MGPPKTRCLRSFWSMLMRLCLGLWNSLKLWFKFTASTIYYLIKWAISLCVNITLIYKFYQFDQISLRFSRAHWSKSFQINTLHILTFSLVCLTQSFIIIALMVRSISWELLIFFCYDANDMGTLNNYFFVNYQLPDSTQVIKNDNLITMQKNRETFKVGLLA